MGYILVNKYPKGQPAHPDALLQMDSPSPPHPVLFDNIDATAVRLAALHTEGTAGPSGMDAYRWRRICTCFQHASNDLCHALALMARRISSTMVDPQGLSAFTACHLIALDKNPGVRPIRICAEESSLRPFFTL